MQEFEEQLRADLTQYLTELGKIDERMPECPDVEMLYNSIAEAYLPDGIREFNDYPLVSLGWMMFVGMALAKMWDEDWDKHSKRPNLYLDLRNRRGYDEMDEHILQAILRLNVAQSKACSELVGNCASRAYNALCRQRLEPATPEAFKAYAACLRQMYLMGMAIELKRLGYAMRPL